MDNGKGKRTRVAGSTGTHTGRGRLRVAVNPERRHELIREAAYLLSEGRGFDPHWDVTNWLEAERQVDAALVSAPPPGRRLPAASRAAALRSTSSTS
jgi:hypothetical protein